MRTLVLYCHPNPASFVAAARDRVLAGLTASGHEVRLTDLYADGFRPEISRAEHRVHLEPGVASELDPYVADLRWAEALVLVYPTWWSGQPAMLKGWIDRVWGCGVAWELREGTSVVRPLLTDLRRIAIVTTHGSSKFVNALEGESGKRTAFRSIRAVCSRRARTSWIAIYGLDRTDNAARVAWLDEVEARFRRF
ncbi:MAG TPA: NAD(P)H-dependent oxidoreductase [Acidimicrobiia bacterium]|nr:NAD(P)H-dependent oxidoreductase [Acidimicrobiia bacterium]